MYKIYFCQTVSCSQLKIEVERKKVEPTKRERERERERESERETYCVQDREERERDDFWYSSSHQLFFFCVHGYFRDCCFCRLPPTLSHVSSPPVPHRVSTPLVLLVSQNLSLYIYIYIYPKLLSIQLKFGFTFINVLIIHDRSSYWVSKLSFHREEENLYIL